MAIVKPFRGLRPPKEIVEELSCLPYDVMNSEEAARMADGKEKSLLHVTRAEIDCPTGTDVHASTVYHKAVENFQAFRAKGWLREDPEPRFYIYAQTMSGRTQYGLVGCAACADYEKGVIKKHELTRPDKEEDRMVLTRYTNANIEPVFFSYKAVPEIDAIVEGIVSRQPAEYDFTAEDGFGHHFWPVYDPATNQTLEKLFDEKVPFTYVADGHHRTAAAARIGAEKRKPQPNPFRNRGIQLLYGGPLPRQPTQDHGLQPGGPRPERTFRRKFSGGPHRKVHREKLRQGNLQSVIPARIQHVPFRNMVFPDGKGRDLR